MNVQSDLEIWRPIEGYESMYEVSSHSRIRSTRKLFSGDRIMKTFAGPTGYEIVQFKVGGRRYRHFVHRLVAIAFIPNPLNKPQINHINGIKLDNRIENLEWATGKENTCHAVATGLVKRPKGERAYTAKLTNGQVSQIRELYESGLHSQRKLAEKFGVGATTIHSIVNSVSYRP